jgi:opine dehydrogenase
MSTSIAVIGAGNGGFAAAVELTRAGHEVRLFGRTPATIAPIRELGGIEHEGVLGEGFTPIGLITDAIDRAMDGAQVVLMLGPTHAHEQMASAVAPHLRAEQTLFVAPGHTLTLVPNTLRQAGHARPVSCETSTLPYICRKLTPTRVRVSRRAAMLKFAAFPAERTAELADRIRPLFPAIVQVGSVLETVFPYTNAIHHPPALLCNIGRVESTGGDYCHYYDGITPSVGRIIDALDSERVAVAARFGVRIDRLPDHFLQLGYTSQQGRDGGTAYDVFHHSEPNRWIKAPATIAHRFFDEDVPFGLVPLTDLGRLAGVPMPVSEAVITIAGVARGIDYRANGLTLQRLGIDRLDVAGLQALLARGYLE